MRKTIGRLLSDSLEFQLDGRKAMIHQNLLSKPGEIFREVGACYFGLSFRESAARIIDKSENIIHASCAPPTPLLTLSCRVATIDICGLLS